MEAGSRRQLSGFLLGIEKEALRVAPSGELAQTPHPRALGSALTHPHITTDFSEALIELISPPLASFAETTAFLHELHRYLYSRLESEYLWATSMPCIVGGEEQIPIARYGTSNAGKMKHLYRVGLGYRYGRVMQTIAGIHFNFSLPESFWDIFQSIERDGRPRRDFVSDRYFGLIRNLQRVGWLVPYLFGASPAVCKSFLRGRQSELAEFDPDTRYGPFATSLRMGDIGYQNNREHEIGIKACYDDLDEYVATLGYATRTSYPGYEKIGVKVDGEYRQLNANILQIENEYYTTVRPKQVPMENERPLIALKRRGVGYIELRSLDINLYEPLGVDEGQLRFLHALMLYCLFAESPRIHPWERSEIDKNEMAAAHRGREPGLRLVRNGEEVTLRAWAGELLDAMVPLCEALDGEDPARPYREALERQRAAVADPDRTPSARMLHEMRERGEGFHRFARRIALRHRDYFQSLAPDPVIAERLDALAESSLREQRELERRETLSFDEYLTRYFTQTL